MSITEYVRDDLAARLRSGRELPPQLTLDSLAEFYNVSFTPVRAAIADLIEEGLLVKGPNRRLIINAENIASQASVAESLMPLPEPPKDNYPEIVNDMVQQSLLGEELHLREENTADKYGMSRSAIRNIFHRLAGEGILDHIPRRGWRLRPFRHDDLLEYLQAREALETKAMELSWNRIQTSELEKIRQANDPEAFLNAIAIYQSQETGQYNSLSSSEASSPSLGASSHGTMAIHEASASQTATAVVSEKARLPDVDESIHEYLVKTSGNRYIQEFLERQGRYYRLLFQWEDHDASVALETVRQHRAIAEAMLEGDLNRAKRALSNHILHNHPLLNSPSSSLNVR